MCVSLCVVKIDAPAHESLHIHLRGASLQRLMHLLMSWWVVVPRALVVVDCFASLVSSFEIYEIEDVPLLFLLKEKV